MAVAQHLHYSCQVFVLTFVALIDFELKVVYFGLVERYLGLALAEHDGHYFAVDGVSDRLVVCEESKVLASDASWDVPAAALTDVDHHLREGLFAAGELFHCQAAAEVVEVGFRFVEFAAGWYHVVVVAAAVEPIHRQQEVCS